VQVVGIDQTAQVQSSVNNVSVTAPVTNVPNIIACGTSSAQFINYTVNSNNYVIGLVPSDSLTAAFVSQGATFQYVAINGGSQNPNNYISFNAKDALAAGTFDLTNLYLSNMNNIVMMPASKVTFTSYATAVGDFYEGSFTGQFSAGLTTVVHNINGTFRIRRIY
jgi:hypothetical protein